MDQTNKKWQKRCLIHTNKKAKFVKISGVKKEENTNLFQCMDCFNSDVSFQGVNYLEIDQVLQHGEKKIIQKWPPINDYSIIEQLIQFTQTNSKSPSVVEQINTFFTQFKEEIMKKIDLTQKEMMNKVLSLPIENDRILKSYQEISKISQLRDLILNEKKESPDRNQQICQDFISQVEAERENNSQLLQDLLSKCHLKNSVITFDNSNLIKEQILSAIEEINFFKTDDLQNISNTKPSKIADKLFELISNRSNYCSEKFLQQIKSLLQRLGHFFHRIELNNIHLENKAPINFSELTVEQLDKIEQYAEHTSKIKINKEYLNSIQTSPSITKIDKILKSKVNFVSQSFQDQFKKYLIDTYPFMKSIVERQITTDENSFNCISSLSEDLINNLTLLLQRKQDMLNNNNYETSQTNTFFSHQSTRTLELFSKQEIDRIFRLFPIIDLIQIKKQNFSRIEDFQLIKTDYNNGQMHLQISQNNQGKQEVTINQGFYGDVSCVSNIILEKDKNYIFRILFESDIGSYPIIGLTSDGQINDICGYEQYFSCRFEKKRSGIFCYNGDWGIQTQLKGDKISLSQENIAEMRVWLGGQQLEVLDYPQYNYKVGLRNDQQPKLNSSQNFRLFLNLYDKPLKYTIIDALTVENFDS